MGFGSYSPPRSPSPLEAEGAGFLLYGAGVGSPGTELEFAL